MLEFDLKTLEKVEDILIEGAQSDNAEFRDQAVQGLALLLHKLITALPPNEKKSWYQQLRELAN